MKSSFRFEIRCLAKFLTLGLISQLLFLPLLSAQLPEPSSSGDFVLTRDWLLELDGHPVAGLTVHYSQYQVAWLVDGAAIEPMLLDLRTRSVSRIDETAVAELDKHGEAYEFALGEQTFRFAPAPPVLGRQTLAVVEERHPGLVAERVAYATLRSELLAASVSSGETDPAGDVVVRVYFGSWSSASLRLIPRIAAVDDALTGGSVRFEYYGLPQPLIDDAQAALDAVAGVPTVVVKRGDHELGRMTGRALAEPAAALAEILSSQAN